MSKCFSCPKLAQFNCPKCQQVEYCSRQCQISHWPLHLMECQDYCDQQQTIQFYLSQIYLIIKPVLSCIFLSILWVKITYPAEPYYTLPNQSSSSIQTATSVFYSGKETDSNGFFDHPVYPALLIMAQIIVATVIVMLLFKYKFMRTLTAFFSLVVISLLGYFGYLIILQIVVLFNVQLDWVTLIFFLWNFSIVGLLMVFYKGPLWLQQAYLVVMSSLMAYSFTRLPDLTTWVLLGLLAVWDLVAVLCPYGPLRLLVESAKKDNREIPALLYSLMIWMMASPPDDFIVTLPSKVYHPDTIQLQSMSAERPISQNSNSEEEPQNLKLGLGDFVFYSVLVARASLFDWITTVTCTIAVTAGLSMTIFLLAIYRKALPALPISILFGILFYFLGSLMLLPYTQSLTFIEPSEGPLWVGMPVHGSFHL